MPQTRVEIDTIISFKNNGEMLPLYVRCEGQTVKVLSSYKKHEDIAHLTYVCTLNINNIERSVELIYSIKEHKWVMIY